MRRRRIAVLAAVVLSVGAVVWSGTPAPLSAAPGDGASLRFGGTGSGDVDRVKIPLRAGSVANVGAGDFTIEFFLRGSASQNRGTGCQTGDAGWITGNVIVDRDVYGPGDRGDFGVSLSDGRIAFGVSRGSTGATVCGHRRVLDGRWHHIAVTRRASDGRLQLFVDGRRDGWVAGPIGDVSYRVGRTTQWPNDPFLVIGAEKHDAGQQYPSFSGWIDELRLSTVVRYRSSFTPRLRPFRPDAATAALYHFDDSGSRARDAAGSAHGIIRRASADAAPLRSSRQPWRR
jgi:hypothetical protein